MADASILDPSVAAAPKQYTISGSQELLIKSIDASFDGSGAATSWVPAVQLLDSAGELIGTYPMDSSLAAGASADVSFFPSLKRGSGGSGGGGITATSEQVNQSAVNTTIVNNTTQLLNCSSHLSGPVNWTFSGGQFHCAVPGAYAFQAVVQLRTTPWTAGGGYNANIATGAYSIVGNSWVTFPNNSGLAAFPQTIETHLTLPPLVYAAGDVVLMLVNNLDGALTLDFAVQLCSIIGYS